MSVRSGFLLAKEKSPDRRVPGSRSPKGKYRKSGDGATRYKLLNTSDAPANPMGGLPVDTVGVLHGSKATAAKDAAKKRRSPERDRGLSPVPGGNP